MTNKRTCKMNKCRYHYPQLDGTDDCIYGAKTLGDFDKYKKPTNKSKCARCKNYKCRYIEYPLTINGIEYGDIEPWNVGLKPVRVRPCDDERTYFGVYLGYFPHLPSASFDEETGILKFNATGNPCIYIPELNKVVFGSGSWWSEIEDENDIKDITDELINDQWYVKLLKTEMIKESEKTDK